METEKSQKYDIEVFKALNIEKMLEGAKQQNYISYYSICTYAKQILFT